jgi:hypothetical protein
LAARFTGSPTVTPYGDDESRRRAKDLSVLEFITKPADFDLLKAQLRRLSEAANRWIRSAGE